MSAAQDAVMTKEDKWVKRGCQFFTHHLVVYQPRVYVNRKGLLNSIFSGFTVLLLTGAGPGGRTGGRS